MPLPALPPAARGNPSELFLNDRALLLNTLLWMLAVLLIIYGPVIYRHVVM